MINYSCYCDKLRELRIEREVEYDHDRPASVRWTIRFQKSYDQKIRRSNVRSDENGYLVGFIQSSGNVMNESLIGSDKIMIQLNSVVNVETGLYYQISEVNK